MKFTTFLIFISAFCFNIWAQSAPAQNDNSKPVYIPADQRHKELSRYDLIPFTDREKGDPDRYRAVNPQFVKRENGRYFFALTTKKGAKYFDENLKETGVLSDENVEVDLTRTKTATVGGKVTKFVFVKAKGYILAENLRETASDIKAGKWFLFPLKAGKNELYDGTGIARGTIAAERVKLNYGLEKQISGEKFYYAFSTKINLGGKIEGASGWIKASAIATENDPQFDQTFVRKMQMPTGDGDKFSAYEITGGVPEKPSGKDQNGTARYEFGYADKNGTFVAYKVLPNVPLDGKQSVAATDYLKRNDGVINLGFNVAGVSNDTFRIEGANRPLVFYRSSETDATAAIDLFYPKDAAHDGTEIAGKMIFVYGYVAAGNDRRWGWIALGALKKK